MSPLFAAVRRAALLFLPFVAIFVAGVSLSPRVSAQYPGGGFPGSGGAGSGSGGSTPGAAAPGWVPQPRTGVTNPHPGGDYDWTGLTADLKLTSYSGSVFDYPTTPSYGGGGAGAVNRPMETTNSYIGTGGPGGNVDAHAHFTLSGTSTYYWQWVPPNNAAGQPDLTNFPAPPLFVLGKGYGVLSSTLVTSPNAAGLTVGVRISAHRGRHFRLIVDGVSAGSWTAFQSDRGRRFSEIVDDRECAQVIH